MKRWIVCVAACLLLGACNNKRQESGQHAADARPAELRSTVEQPLGAMCFLEKVNNKATRTRPALKAGQPGVFSGWASVAVAERPAPELVHVVLHALSGPQKDTYLKMGRMPRPDLAVNDARREMVGFEGEAALPAAGSYDVLVSQSDGHWQTMCRTGLVLEIGP